MSIFDELDPNGPPEILLEREVELNVSRKIVLGQLRKMVSGEVLDVVHALLDIEQDRSLLCGARMAQKRSPDAEALKAVEEANRQKRIVSRERHAAKGRLQDRGHQLRDAKRRIRELEMQLEAARADIAART